MFDFFSLLVAIVAFILARKAFNQVAMLRARLDAIEAAGAQARPGPPPLEAFERKFIVRTLGFLQAQYVGANGLDEPRHQIDAQPYRIDVPACNGQLHRDQEFSDQESDIRNRENKC